MTRPAKDMVFMRIARELGMLSTCDRASVGAVITKDGRCVSWGFNGAPSGLPHCEYNGHGWGTVDHQEGKPDWKELNDQWIEKAALTEGEMARMPWDWRGGTDYLASIRGCRNVTHAEANALAYAARQGISTDGGTCYVVMSPCDVCARLLVAAGIHRVVYADKYRDESGLILLFDAGVDTSWLNP